jgi:hypothetical protein
MSPELQAKALASGSKVRHLVAGYLLYELSVFSEAAISQGEDAPGPEHLHSVRRTILPICMLRWLMQRRKKSKRESSRQSAETEKMYALFLFHPIPPQTHISDLGFPCQVTQSGDLPQRNEMCKCEKLRLSKSAVRSAEGIYVCWVFVQDPGDIHAL